MDDKLYSLNDIFGYLREATLILNKPLTVVTDEGSTKMLLSEYIAMSVANELTSETSRMASEDNVASKELVKEALKVNYYDEVTYPEYGNHGIIYGAFGSSGKRKTRRSSKKNAHRSSNKAK